MKQLSIYEIEQEKKPKRCANCVYWELLPADQQPRRWTTCGYCNRHSQDIVYFNNGCEFYNEWTEEPYWRKQLKQLSHYRLLEHISLLEIKYNDDPFKHETIKSCMENWEEYWTKNGIVCKQENL